MATRFTRVFGRLRRSHYALGAGGVSAGALYLFQSSKEVVDSDSRVEQTFFNPQRGISRVDSISVPSNFPCEDRMTTHSVPSKAWSFWAIYDGHSGPQTSTLLEKRLIPSILEKLRDLYGQTKSPENEPIHNVFKTVFVDLDDEIVNKSAALVSAQPEGAPRMTLAASILQAAHAGSCALVAFYESNVCRLHVAVLGDSRAILGRPRQTAEGKTVYDLRVLSIDQNTKNPAEAARLTAAHPDEPALMDREKGRLLGWGITRAFGDGKMKWSRELQTWMEKEVLGDKPRPVLLTPPYFIAEPEVTTIEVQPGDFMIMASDGMWDALTNEDAVGLVGAWIERWGTSVVRSAPAVPAVDAGIDRKDLPVEITDDETMYRWHEGIKKRFTNEDSFNVASHLARNALGGANRDFHDALLATPAPRSRRLRDDISVFVVFFD